MMQKCQENAPLSLQAMRLLLKLAQAAQPAAKTKATGDHLAIAELQRHDLIEAAHGGCGFALSGAGRAALKRALARNEPFREQHEERALKPMKIAGIERTVAVNDAESPLAWLRKRHGKDGKPLIGEQQYQAGERLRADFTKAQLEPRVTANWNAIGASRQQKLGAGVQNLNDSALAARMRVEKALIAVGPELANILLDVCCFLKGIEDAERNNTLPQRSGKIVLKLALNALARHYGLLREDSRQPARRALEHWGSPDYRPSLASTEDV